MKFSKSCLMAVSAFYAFAGTAWSAQVCNLVLNRCPSAFPGTITVPENVIWLDPIVPVCSDTVQVVTGNTSPPPSIVFIIDNSGSMSSGNDGDAVNNGWNDPTEARFRVVKTLLDTIYKASPKAEVGMVIFTRRLSFDHRDNPFFKPAFPADTSQHDSFVPLTPLDKPFGGGVLGIDTLKALLTYSGHGNLKYATAQANSRPSSNGLDPKNVRDGTDITLGFDGAKEAMKDSKAAKGDQYFIFLSDGEPSGVDTPRNSVMYDFEKGVGAATTFTVFFKANTSDPTPPDRIKNMTEAIKTNGYSTSNPKSAAFAISLPGSQLLALLQSNVLNPIFANTNAKPASAVLDVGGTKYNSTSVDAKVFTFPKRVPLSPAQTAVNLTYTFQYTDSGQIKTSTRNYTLNLNRTGSAPLADGLSTSCQEQGNITLFNKGNPITVVTADHNDLDVHLTLGSGEVCNGCKVEVKPNKSADKETVALTPASGFQTGNFGRETSNTVAVGDGKLQHLPTDSIIVIYVNPDNSLDVIRKAFPYSDVSTVLVVLRHNTFSQGGDLVPPKPGEHFVLVTPGSISPTPEDKAKNWIILPNLATEKDSVRYVGDVIQASRAFKVEIVIFTNLGQFVNKIAFTVPPAEFSKLAKSAKGNTRQLKVLWDNMSADGTKAGTGGYILKTTVTLLKIPGVAEDEAVSTDYRRVGVLRGR
ncbi:MAG: hypothetical protein JWP91_2774 [Fibrobacteres bacterium]|nr:hypothetical protein [Fibrobacterota bacterium]